MIVRIVLATNPRQIHDTMALMKCFKCAKPLLYLAQHHACSSGKSTGDEPGKRVFERATVKRVATGESDGGAKVGSSPARPIAGEQRYSTNGVMPVATIGKNRDSTEDRPSDRKLGRPRIGEVRDKPWEEMGMSQRTWQRRQAEQRAKQ